MDTILTVAVPGSRWDHRTLTGRRLMIIWKGDKLQGKLLFYKRMDRSGAVVEIEIAKRSAFFNNGESV